VERDRWALVHSVTSVPAWALSVKWRKDGETGRERSVVCEQGFLVIAVIAIAIGSNTSRSSSNFAMHMTT
jgi:hypothetical protein